MRKVYPQGPRLIEPTVFAARPQDTWSVDRNSSGSLQSVLAYVVFPTPPRLRVPQCKDTVWRPGSRCRERPRLKPGISAREIVRFGDGSRATACGLSLDSRLVLVVDVSLTRSSRRGKPDRRWLARVSKQVLSIVKYTYRSVDT